MKSDLVEFLSVLLVSLSDWLKTWRWASMWMKTRTEQSPWGVTGPTSFLQTSALDLDLQSYSKYLWTCKLSLDTAKTQNLIAEFSRVQFSVLSCCSGTGNKICHGQVINHFSCYCSCNAFWYVTPAKYLWGGRERGHLFNSVSYGLNVTNVKHIMTNGFLPCLQVIYSYLHMLMYIML